uniref:Protein kinase domain-containing protein n=1 Tax=Esox lucius TaxID=8010 RepID=A0AAY5K0E6_ESOLU
MSLLLRSCGKVYHTLDVVGKGTFGKVSKCWRGSDGELVAVKMMKIDVLRNQIIKNELKLTGALSRTNIKASHIVQFHEAFRDQTHHYLVFELLEKNLYQLLKENGFMPMAIRNIRTITCQIIKALVKLKELAIIHADLKPENVMVVDHCRHPFRVKLIDFGSASILNEVRFVKEPYIQSRFYRSPEILLGLPFCEKVDMWSLGCVMAELFLGWPLYPGDSEFDQVCYICETTVHDTVYNVVGMLTLFHVDSILLGLSASTISAPVICLFSNINLSHLRPLPFGFPTLPQEVQFLHLEPEGYSCDCGQWWPAWTSDLAYLGYGPPACCSSQPKQSHPHC